MTAGMALILLLSPIVIASDFIEALRRCRAREDRDPERIEFASRAIHSWTPSDGSALLADAYFQRAKGELAAENGARAENDAAKTLELDPRNDSALFLRGRARLMQNKAAPAEHDFSEYASGHPDDGEGWLGLAESRLALGLPRADKPAFSAAQKAAMRLNRSDPRPLIAEGRARLASSRPLESLSFFNAAVSRGGEYSAESFAWRAQAHAALGNAEAARDDGAKAAENYERRLTDRLRTSATETSVAVVRAQLADVRFRRGQSEEILRLKSEAVEDYRLSCDLGRADACARAKELSGSAEPVSQPKRPRKSNPTPDSGTRIYAS